MPLNVVSMKILLRLFNTITILPAQVFQAKLGRAARVANAHGLEKSFGVELTSMMHRWNTAPPAVRDQGMVRVEGKIQGVKKVMHQNVKELLKREEAMEMLVDRTESLQEEAVVFKRRSEMVKEKMKQVREGGRHPALQYEPHPVYRASILTIIARRFVIYRNTCSIVSFLSPSSSL